MRLLCGIEFGPRPRSSHSPGRDLGVLTIWRAHYAGKSEATPPVVRRVSCRLFAMASRRRLPPAVLCPAADAIGQRFSSHEAVPSCIPGSGGLTNSLLGLAIL
jgi:hypothetical protein